MDGRVDVSLLGPTEVCDAHGGPIELPRGRSRALLALLALSPRRVVSTDRLIAELWGTSPPATVVTALHGLVSVLRKHIEPTPTRGEPPVLLLTRAPGYLLDVAPDQIDVHRFRRMVRDARRAGVEERIELLRAALSVWRGPALADVEFAGSASSEALALEELRLVAHEDLVDAQLRLGRHRDLIGELGTLISAHPLRERLYAQLMLAHYRSGSQGDALEVWRRARAVLVEELGVEPGPGLRRLHRAVLEQDPALELVAPEVSPRPADGAAQDEAARAGKLLAAAGARVFDHHYDAATAEELFSCAVGLLPADHPRRQDVADRIPGLHLMLGRPDDADASLQRSLIEARRQGDARRESYLRLERARFQLIAGPDPIPMAEIEDVARRALAIAEEAGDDSVVSQVCYVLGLMDWRRGRIRTMERWSRRGVATAERSGSQRERLASRWILALALVEGPTPVDDALAECKELAELGVDPHLGVLTEVARLHALRGEHEVAAHVIQRARDELGRRPGMRRPAMFVAQRAAEVLLLAGEPWGAEPHLRTALALADGLGEAEQRAQLAAKLALVLVGRGGLDEAAELAHRSRHTAPAESVRAQVLWRAAMAAVRSALGAEVEGRRLAGEASSLVHGEMILLAAEIWPLGPEVHPPSAPRGV